MAFKVEYKFSPYSSWTTVGSSYGESEAYSAAARKKSERPESIVHVVDMKTGSVVLSL